jgi:hypothetical protein
MPRYYVERRTAWGHVAWAVCDSKTYSDVLS